LATVNVIHVLIYLIIDNTEVLQAFISCMSMSSIIIECNLCQIEPMPARTEVRFVNCWVCLDRPWPGPA